MTVELTTLPDLMPALPEILLAIGALGLLLLGTFGNDQNTQVVNGLAVALLILAGALLLLTPNGSVETFHGSFVLDSFARLMKVLILLSTGLAFAISVGYSQVEKFERSEFPVLILLCCVGMMLMLSANDLITLYIGLELQSVALYVIVTIRRDSMRATEAGLKFFVPGTLSTAILLYGASLVYGFTGQTSFAGIAEAIHVNEASLGILFGLVFLLAGLLFKISAVPFHMWTPDVYEGAPTPVSAFLAAAPKIAALGLTVRLVLTAFEPMDVQWQEIIMILSMLSMIVGSLAGLVQRNIKRLVAYASIGHMGYALVGLAAGSSAGVVGVIIYAIIYCAMMLGAFSAILAMRQKDGMVEYVDDLSGLAQTNLPLAVLIGIIMLSLAGIPWTGGFIGKWFVFAAAIEAGLYPLAIVGILTTVIVAYRFVSVVKVMFFDDPLESFEKPAGELRLVLFASSVFLFTVVIYAGVLKDVAEHAARSFF